MAGMTMIVFEIDGREVMLSDADSIHTAMTNGTVKADMFVTVYLADGAKHFKPAAQHKQLAAYFPVAVEPESPTLSPIEENEPAPEPKRMPMTTAERLRALEEEIEANPAANRPWTPPIEAARPLPTALHARPNDARYLGQPPSGAHGGKSRVAAAILALILGGIGAHKFYMGKTKAGWIMVALFAFGLFTAGTFLWVAPIIALIEAIIYLTQSDEEFEERYINAPKDWF